MERKEQILKELRTLGFVLNEIPEFGYVFDYEDSRILYIPTEDDDDTIGLAIPCIFEVNDDNRVLLMEIVNKVNAELKYVKAGIMDDDNIWLQFEHYTIGDYPLDELLAKMIRVLSFSKNHLLRLINGDIDDDEINTEETPNCQQETITEVELKEE